MILSVIILALLVAALAIVIWSQRRETARLRPFEAEVKVKDSQIEALNQRLEEAALSRQHADEERRRADDALADRLQLLSSKIFASSAEESDKRLRELLTPLTQDLKDFRKSVKEAYDTEARERFSLAAEIRRLVTTTQSISDDARELALALRGDSKAQGDWGEMILERLLESTSLKKGVHYSTQLTTNPSDGKKIASEEGRALRPDVVIWYPRERCVVVDSKVSLTAFVDFMGASDPDKRADAEKRHLKSVKTHIDELSRKSYQDLVGEYRLDFTVMFIPNEAAYLTAMAADAQLWQYAYDRRVVIASPTHLISMLRLLEQLWRQDAINKNVEEIARLSGAMIDKFGAVIDDIDAAGRSLDAAAASYASARKRLAEGKGNALDTARRIVKLGAKNKKHLPADESVILPPTSDL